MLEIKDLHASINGKEILKGINLTIRDGEVHALMGQNGAGKSTLSNVLVGHPAYEVTRGSITFNGKDLLAMSPEDRAHEGIFLSFQAPVEIPGVRDIPDGDVGTDFCYFGRDGFRIGCGCFAYCGRRFQQTQDCGNQCYGHYPLPAVVGLYQTRYGTCTAGWTYRKDRWTGIGEGD